MEAPKSSNTALIVGIIVVLCCIGILVLGVGGYALYSVSQTITDGFPTILPGIPTDFPFGTDAPAFDACNPNAGAVMRRPAADSVPVKTLEALKTTIVAENDPPDLACRLEGKCEIPETMAPPAAPRVAGDTDTFWATNVQTNENFEVDATLRYVTPHLYFWVQDDVDFDQGELTALADAFENKIYPTDREFFGSEWTPGIDQDPHIYILYARGIGYSIAGYFSAADEVHPLAHEYSNAHEMFLFNADNTQLRSEFTYGVLAHEFQHMIHWYQDRNETSWINEGFSEVASFLNDYDPGGFDWLYISDPDLQLNDWPNEQDCTSPHYGSGFLFLTYFLDRFGEDATKALVKDPDNGFDSVDNVLGTIGAVDGLTGQPILADDLFMDWAVTNYLLDDSVADGRYAYHNYPGANHSPATETVSSCPQAPFSRDVHQYGVDYVSIPCPGEFTLTFTGSTATGLLPASAYSGDYAFWSNKGDESDMTLTREFDFTGVSGPIEFTFRTWYDLEVDYDYIFLEVSEDGEHWQIITTPSGTAEDPSGNSYGWGYNGVTDDWIEESVDISQYAGKKAFVRFEYVTDAAVNGEGFLLDDVSVAAVNYSTDFEADDGGWIADGFARVQNILPQTFRLALILRGDETTVQMIPLDAEQVAEVQLSLESGQEAILVISGTTRFTRELAPYQIEIR